MIILFKDIDNNVPMTLNENATRTQHDWLIEFINDMTGEKTYLTPTDISPATNRYNEFIISGHGLTGFSKYNVYEMPVMSPKSTNVSIAYALCETGKMELIDPSENKVQEFNTEENKNNAVFE